MNNPDNLNKIYKSNEIVLVVAWIMREIALLVLAGTTEISQ